MSEQESQRAAEDQDGDDRGIESAAPEDEQKVVGENADVPAGEGEEADEAGVEGGSDSGQASGADDSDGEAGEEDDRDELAKEIESDPASNPDDPALKEIKGG